MMTYKTTGTCSREINFDIDEVDGVKVVRNVSFVGGCNGNLKGIGKLVEGMPVEEVIRRLEDMKRIVFTGGGTAGHVTPNIALIARLREEDYDIYYIGSYQGIEKELIEKLGIPYYGISSGKLRRYFDRKNFSDMFRVVKGFREAKKILRELKPDIVFSKGGFVSVPVCLAAKRCKIPAIVHESDMTPGLANKLAIPSAVKVCANFPETVQYLPEGKAVLTGTPIRRELFAGNRIRGLEFCGFRADRPVIMVVGGSTGALAVNEAVRNLLPTLLKRFQVVHLCGKGKTDASYNNIAGYVQYASCWRCANR